MIATADSRSTIVAIASSTAPAMRGIVRIAGEDAVRVLLKMAPGLHWPSSEPRSALRRDVELDLGSPLGEVPATALIWPNTRSYTGSPSVELHTYGSVPILESIVAAAIRAGARPAGPGEFTMRAFLAGRLDLPQAEAVLGVIDAADRGQLDAALSQLAGNVSQPLRQVRDDLLNLLADLEAGLDFVEEDIHFIDDATVEAQLRCAAEVIATAAKQMSARHRGTAVSDVVLRGEPNAGKSSLLNALVGENVALVSGRAGTTRDVLWRETTILGRPVRLIDTAGLELERDEITRQSQSAARESQKTAAVTLLCVPRGAGDRLRVYPETSYVAAQRRPSLPRPRLCGGEGWGEGDSGEALCGDGRAAGGEHANDNPLGPVVPVATQCDLADEAECAELRRRGWLVTSAVTGLGLEALRERIAVELDAQVVQAELGVSATAARCSDTIARAAQSLQAAQELIAGQAGHEWAASEIRLALSAIGEITGEIYTDDILDRVFSRFCIGK